MAPESAPISRREFLKGAAGGAALLSELFNSREAFAQLEKLLPVREFIPESFETGIERLRKDTFEKANERFYVFVKKGTISGWLNIEASSDSMGVTTIELTNLFVDEKIEEMHFVHTHPFMSVAAFQGLSQEQVRRGKEKKKSLHPYPPSIIDIKSMIGIQLVLKQKKNNAAVKESAVDPAGCWTFKADLDHKQVKKIIKGIEAEMSISPGRRIADREVMNLTLNTFELELMEQRKRIHEAETEGAMLKRIRDYNGWIKTKWGVHQTFRPHQERKP